MKRKEPYQLPDDARLKMVKRISKLMDEEFSIGGFKFGLDPLLNFIPIAGDAGTYLISVAMLITMVQHGVSGKVAMKMLGNITLDALIGAIPVIGWIFDFTYKANMRNTKLLAEYYTEGKHTGSARKYIFLILLVVLLVFVLTIYIAWKIVALIAGSIDNNILGVQ